MKVTPRVGRTQPIKLSNDSISSEQQWSYLRKISKVYLMLVDSIYTPLVSVYQNIHYYQLSLNNYYDNTTSTMFKVRLHHTIQKLVEQYL